MAGGTVRNERTSATRQAILSAAERLFAEHGVLAVSNRQISEAAGQGNNTAVGYHFGAKADLLRAILRSHNEHIDRIRTRMVDNVEGSDDIRDWVECMVRPTTEHLAVQPSPTWFGRFAVQLAADPQLREMMSEESFGSQSVVRMADGINRCLPSLPAEVRLERGDMARQLLVHTIAERERAIAEALPTPRTNWRNAGDGLVDALVGLWSAPVTNRS